MDLIGKFRVRWIDQNKMCTNAPLVNLNMAAKNLRRPRNSHGRRLPKEGDAGGKGTWGKLGDEMELPWVSRI